MSQHEAARLQAAKAMHNWSQRPEDAAQLLEQTDALERLVRREEKVRLSMAKLVKDDALEFLAATAPDIIRLGTDPTNPDRMAALNRAALVVVNLGELSLDGTDVPANIRKRGGDGKTYAALTAVSSWTNRGEGSAWDSDYNNLHGINGFIVRFCARAQGAPEYDPNVSDGFIVTGKEIAYKLADITPAVQVDHADHELTDQRIRAARGVAVAEQDRALGMLELLRNTALYDEPNGVLASRLHNPASAGWLARHIEASEKVGGGV